MNPLLTAVARHAALLLLFCVCGCARPAPPSLAPLPSTTELLARLDAVTSRYQTLQASARIRVVTEKENVVASQLLLVQRPDRLRSEVLGPFATPMLSLSADSETLAVHLPLQGTFYRGGASAANVARFTRMPLRVADLVGILLVAPPRFPFAQAAVSRSGSGERLDLSAPGGVEQRFTFDAAGHLLQAAYLIGERLQLQADYGEFDPARADFPAALQVAMPERQVSASIVFREIEVNATIPPARFTLPVPAGFEVKPLPE